MLTLKNFEGVEYWADENDNRWYADDFSEEQAKAFAKTM